MKLFSLVCLLLLSLAFTQLNAQTNYNTQWKQVDALIQKKKLPKSALASVNKIYSQAKKDGNHSQRMKALIYQLHLQNDNREGNEILSIKETEKELAESNKPYTSLLNSMLADLYWSYFQEHRWQLYDRAATEESDSADFTNWNTTEFHEKISSLYLASLGNKTLLQQTPLEPLSVLIVKGNVSHLRPTLYDLLAFKALAYFENDEPYVTKPEYSFTLSEPKLFASANEFAKLSIETKDTTSLLHKALLIYQELFRLHANDKVKDALIDADIQRIAFVYRNAVMQNKKELYVEALQRFIKEYEGNKAANSAGYLLAMHYNELANDYSPLTDSTHRYERKKAEAILQKIVADSSVKNEGWVNSFNLLQEIRKPSLSLKVEKVNLPAEPFRAFVEYNNLTQVHAQLIPVSQKLLDLLKDADEDENWKILSKQKAIKKWIQALPATNDLQEHGVEIRVDGLPSGQYFLLLSADINAAKKNTAASAVSFWVSNISFVNRYNDFFVLHRKTGEPLNSATMEVLGRDYNRKLSKYITKLKGKYTTNPNGLIRVNGKDISSYDNYLRFRYKNETLALDEQMYLTRYFDDPVRTREYFIKVFFYKDRTIYRPGQPVFFKAIMVKDAGHAKKSVLANYPVTIYLFDANGEKRDSVKLTSNEFGSVNGKFNLPSNLLNGNFSIRTKIEDSWSSTDFSVEEYKRPKFYVEFDKTKESYKVGDSVHLVVNAKAYAGGNIANAKVSYEVRRSNRGFGLKRWLPYNLQQIAHGEKQTDIDGKLVILFVAEPDKEVDTADHLVFDYSVTATVTDINGETHSETEIISIGYISLIVSVSVDEKQPVDSLNKIFVQTENLQGEFTEAKLSVSLYKLLPENRMLRTRFWDRPDQFVMSKQEYVNSFPFDEYSDESNYQSWPKQLVETITINSTEDGKVTTAWKNVLAAGHYLVQVSAMDKDGRKMKDEVAIELFDAETTGKPEFLWVHNPERSLKPGEHKDVQLATTAQNLYIIKEVDRGRKTLKDESRFSYERLNGERKTFRFDATEDDRGGYNFSILFVKENRVYYYHSFINVPWSNKNLAVEFASFRNKTEPGAKETWRVKIKGEAGSKASAEMLASMYDASLDAFRPHYWNAPPLWPDYSQHFQWVSHNSFQAESSDDKYFYLPGKTYLKEYDAFLFDRNGREAFWWLNPYRYVFRDGTWKDVGYFWDRRKGVPPPSLQMAKFSEGLLGRVQGVVVQEGNAMTAPKFSQEVAMNFASSISDDMSPTRGNNYKRTDIRYFTNGDGISDKFDSEEIQRNKATQNVQPRKNLSETAFFFPTLITNENGEIEFSFTAPEALTKWKLQTFAHTKELAFGTASKELLTQKTLMVQPNLPRFVRQNDTISIQTKISNLSADVLNGEALLQLFDAATNEPVNGFQYQKKSSPFSVKGNGSSVVSFPVIIPENFNSSLTWRITATAANEKNVSFSDGEESSLPVLPATLLVTETLPLVLKGTTKKEIRLDKLVQSANSSTIKHQSLTVEATTNPAWYVVQALPYLMEFPYECAEQTWNRYYANALAATITNSSPRIQGMFEKWKADTTALKSNLEKNEELKSVLLQETPWVLEAKTESAQKRNIALLFDKSRTQVELSKNLSKLRQLQKGSGAFAWFAGGPDDRYITQYILTGIGRLMKLKALDKSKNDLAQIVKDGLSYLDKQIQRDYEAIIKSKRKDGGISGEQIQYLYMRSFYDYYPIQITTAFNYFKTQAVKSWQNESKSLQAMIALALFRNGDSKTPAAILASLKETAIVSEERGMYWKEMEGGRSWYWQDAPIETSALMIEAFAEAANDKATVLALQTWLIQNKQTNNWGSTKATADACYAVIMQNNSLLKEGASVNIKLGSNTADAVVFSSSADNAEEGTGYFKRTISANEIKPGMGVMTVTTKSTNASPIWTNIYWKYFENMDKITAAATPLKLAKEVFLERITDKGPQLVTITNSTPLKTGDKLKIRIQLIADRDMEYVHLKDLRAAGFEPLNVFSGYRWQNATGYYESTKDASTNFFFDKLPKGTYVFEYPVYVAQSGNFGNGIATVQCMYAPQFSAHSEGKRVEVK